MGAVAIDLPGDASDHNEDKGRQLQCACKTMRLQSAATVRARSEVLAIWVALKQLSENKNDMNQLREQEGAQPALHFGGDNFHEISFDDVIVFIQPWHNFFANGHI